MTKSKSIAGECFLNIFYYGCSDHGLKKKGGKCFECSKITRIAKVHLLLTLT